MRNRKDEVVYFFTNEVNISFVQQEINNLAGIFSTVYVYASNGKSEVKFPGNVVLTEADYTGYSTSGIVAKNFFTVLGLAFLELVRTPKYFSHFSVYLKSLSQLLRCLHLSEQVKNSEGFKPGNAVFYTFWFNQWATVLSLLARKKIINKYYSRTHGTDLYEYRVPKIKRIPFRWFQLKHNEGVFSVSMKGADYLRQMYPQHSGKIHSSYLGSKDLGMAAFDPGKKFTILSCANVRNIKRIHFIPEILQHLDFDVKWIHVGNENLNSKDVTIPVYKKNKENLKAKSNIEVECKGALTNEEVLQFYKTNNINLFISVSETEGLPVSMMEAISFGIPVISTDVGGCSEIVNEATGVLIPKDFVPSEVAETIKQFRLSEKNTPVFRKKARAYWERNFNGEVNFKIF